MPRGFQIAILAALLIGASGTTAAARFVPGCANPADSALNQYCDTLPAAGGPQTPHPGVSAVRSVLPAGLARAIRRSHGTQTQARRALLRLPAPERVRVERVGIMFRGAKTGSGLPPWLYLVLAALALAMLVAAVASRRRRPGPPPPVSGQASA